MSSTSEICKRLADVQERVRKACKRANRNPHEITLVAISKLKPVSDIRDALMCGQLHFGENRTTELNSKADDLEGQKLVWHYVGTMQTNKIKYLAGRAAWIHSAYKTKHLKEIDKRLKASGQTADVLLQVNISRESQKQGLEPSGVEQVLKSAQSLKNLRVSGLMGMATFADNPEEVRSEFRLLRNTLLEHRHLNSGSVQLRELSMGMTNDFEVAIEEGATMIRIGSAIFGERNGG
ncbi:MAG: YggS family pyridoxal phosphate-dependent enzyme [Balneolaceae bacterium]